MASHALVFWTGENKYSVVSAKKIKVGTDTFNTSVIGKTYPVKWKKDRHYDAEIMAIGSKREMQEQEHFWESKATEFSFTDQEVEEAGGGQLLSEVNDDFNDVDSSSQLDNVEDVAPTDNRIDGKENSPVHNELEFEDNWEKNRIRELEEQLISKDIEVAKEKAKNRYLRRALKRSAPQENDGEVVNIGGRVVIPKKLDNFIKLSFTYSPSLFFRKLIFEGGVISIEDVAGSSITGKKTIQSPASGVRPGLDPTLFKILKDYTAACCSLQPNTVDMLKFEARIRSVCTDARKKVKTTSKTTENAAK